MYTYMYLYRKVSYELLYLALCSISRWIRETPPARIGLRMSTGNRRRERDTSRHTYTHARTYIMGTVVYAPHHAHFKIGVRARSRVVRRRTRWRTISGCSCDLIERVFHYRAIIASLSPAFPSYRRIIFISCFLSANDIEICNFVQCVRRSVSVSVCCK